MREKKLADKKVCQSECVRIIRTIRIFEQLGPNSGIQYSYSFIFQFPNTIRIIRIVRAEQLNSKYSIFQIIITKVWKYFHKDEQNKDKVLCDVCEAKLSSKGGTTTPLINHLKPIRKNIQSMNPYRHKPIQSKVQSHHLHSLPSVLSRHKTRNYS